MLSVGFLQAERRENRHAFQLPGEQRRQER
jgi:hypothetical protein